MPIDLITLPQIEATITRGVAMHAVSVADGNLLFFSLLSPILALVFTACFFVLWIRWSSLSYLPLVAVAFLLHSVAALCLILRVPAALFANSMLTCVVYTMAAFALTRGCTLRLGKPANAYLQLLLSLFIIAGVIYFSKVDNDLRGRIYVENLGYGTIILAGVLPFHNRNKRAEERLLFWMSLLFGFHFFPRTLLSTMALGQSFVLDTYTASAFWMWLNVASIFFVVLLGVALLVLAGSDIVRELEKQASIDSLTGLLNRRAFERDVTLMPAAYSLIMCDVDHFKQINDGFGHACGDAVLQRISAVLTLHVRQNDIVARLGGEEFVALLPGMLLPDAYRLGERLREAIEDIKWEGSLSPLRVTASFGVIETLPHEDLHDVLRRADHALYKAKYHGRNCVMAGGELEY